jgi:LmbE family N-acetylglucosaminyl deacetylase
MPPFVSPHLATEPLIVTPATVEQGAGRTLLLIVAHADDPAFFVGGVLPLWADAGWRIVCLRVTDDRWDSFGLGEAETIRRNTEELHAAAKHLGIAEIHELGWQTDVLGDASRVKLRECIIHAIRRFKPHGLVTCDPNAMFFEDNLDHKVLAEAVDEAYWTAKFDKHHPEHFSEGLAPHGAVDRWYFGRSVVSVTHVFDTSSTIERQLAAILCHRTMLENISRQLALQAKTMGVSPPLIGSACEGEPRPLFETLLAQGAAAKAKLFGLKAAETLRLNRACLPEHALELRTILAR